MISPVKQQTTAKATTTAIMAMFETKFFAFIG
jgi:hypothetical protein